MHELNNCNHESHSRIDPTLPQVEPSMRPAATHVHEHAWFQYAETRCVFFWVSAFVIEMTDCDI